MIAWKKALYALLVVFLSLFTLSCNSDEDKDPATRNFRYEVSGTVTTPVEVSYTPTILDPFDSLEDLEYQETVMLPWTKEVTLHHLVAGVGLFVGVEDGIAGQSVTMKIYRNDQLVVDQEGVVNADGDFSILINYYNDGTVTVHD